MGFIKAYPWIRSSANFRSKASGNWNSYSTWEIQGEDGGWYDSPYYPESGNNVDVQLDHVVTLTQNEQCKELHVSGEIIYSEFTITYDEFLTYISAASIVDETQKTAIETMVATIKDNEIWDKILDFGLFWGGSSESLSNALVKIKHPSEFGILLNDGSSPFDDTNYSDEFGVTKPTSTFKRLGTQIILEDHGLSKDNFCVGIAVLSDNSAGAAGNLLIDNKESGAPGIFLGKTNMGIKGGSLLVVYASEEDTQYFNTISSNGEVIYVRDFCNIITNQTVPDVDLDTEISLFTGRSQGVEVSTGGKIGAYYISSYLTYSEIVILNKAIEAMLISTGRKNQLTKDCAVLGDSITYGVGASAYDKKWCYLYTREVGLTERNCGLSGSQFLNANGPLRAGYDRFPELLNYDISGGGQLIFMLGVNDCRTDSGATGLKTAEFKTKLIEKLQQAKDSGLTASEIIVGSLPWVNDGTPQTRMDAYAAAAFEAAQTVGVYYADVNAYMLANGGATLISGDGIHPNDAGHEAIKDALLLAAAV